MNSNRKIKVEGTKTPLPGHLNTSEYTFKNSATKKFSPNLSRRPNLNQTVGFRCGTSSDQKFKTCLATTNEVNYEFEYDSVYNDYLQAQMKKQFVVKKVREHIQILEDQLLIQKENVNRRQQNCKEIILDTDSFETRSEIVQLIIFLEKTFGGIANLFCKYKTAPQLNNFKETLDLKCDKICLRNIKAPENQEEYDKFFRTIESCLSVIQKIMHSGRSFEEIQRLAENIRKLYNLIDTVRQSRQTISILEKDTLYNFLQNMSDFFAKKYERCG